MFPNRSRLNFPQQFPQRESACILRMSLLVVCLLALADALLGHAQAVGSGQIQGMVLDTNGSAVPDASVEAIQTESGLHRAVKSGGDGGYNLPSLPVGHYEI